MNARLARLRERWQTTRTVLTATKVRIELFGSADALSVQRTFMSRHPRLPIMARKRWGVALIELPPTFAEYLAGGSKQAVRTNRRRATSAGYRHEIVRTLDHLDEIFEINGSEPLRQGRPMAEDYLDRAEVQRIAEIHPVSHGIVDADGRLRAYAITRDVGDAIVLSTILGHADALDDGVMYLLVSEVIRTAIEDRRPDGSPHWFMYDTYWGAKPGLAYFKRRAGFLPYTVDWVWIPDRSLVPAAAGGGPLPSG